MDRLIPVPEANTESIYIESAEVEALRLVDFEGALSRGNWSEDGRIQRNGLETLIKCKKKTAQAFTEGSLLNSGAYVSESNHST